MAALPERIEAVTSDYCRSQTAVDPAVVLGKTRKATRRAADQMEKTQAHPASEMGTEYSEVGRRARRIDQALETGRGTVVSQAAGPGSVVPGSVVPESVGPESVGPRVV